MKKGYSFSKNENSMMIAKRQGHKCRNNLSKKVRCYNNGEIYNSITEAAKALSLNGREITTALRIFPNSVKGFIFNQI